MKHLSWVFLALLALPLLVTPLAANQAWPQPLGVVESQNMEFSGKGCVLADGSYLISWSDYTDIVFNARVMRYSSSHQELWPQPLSLENTIINRILPTLDGGFLLVYSDLSTYMRARRYDAQAQPLWNGQEFGLGIYVSGFDMAIAEEASGSIWILCVSESDSAIYHYISPSGVPAATYGTIIGLSWNAASPSLITCPGGGVILSFIMGHQVRLYRVAQNQSITWQQTVSAQPYTYINKLLRDNPDSFYLVFGCNTLLARRYNNSGQQLWPADVQVGSSQIDSFSNWKAWLAQDGGLRAIWLASDGLHMGGVSPEGDLLPEPPVLAMDIEYGTRFQDLHSLPGSAEPAFLSLYMGSGIMKYLCCRLDETGFMDAQPIQMATTQSYPGHYAQPWFGVVGGELQCVYSHIETDHASLMRASCDADAVLGSDIISTGSMCSFSEPVATASGRNVLCAWLETDITSSDSDYRKRLRYQLFTPNGAPLMDQPGILPCSGSYAPIGVLKAISLPEGQFLLFWRESTTPKRIRMQLVSPSGSPLWEPEGRIAAEGSISNYSISLMDPDLYIAFDGGNEIRLQKISSGQPLWGDSGISLASGSTGSTNVQLLTRGCGSGYIAYGEAFSGSTYIGYDCVKVLRYDSSGCVQPGFGSDGISFYPEVGAIKMTLGAATSTPQGLLMRLDHGYEHEDGYGSWMSWDYSFGHLVGSQGQTPWAGGIPEYGGYLLGSDAEGIYRRLVTNTQSLIQKHDYSGQQLWMQACPVTGHNTDRGDYSARRLSDGTWIGLALVDTGNYSPTLKYYSFTSGGGVNVPADTRLEDRALVDNASLASSGDALYVIWGLSGAWSQEYTHLYMQKIITGSSSGDDPHETVPAVTLAGIHPNPFSSNLTIGVECLRTLPGRLSVYDLRGRKVRELASGMLETGSNTYTWDGRDASGDPVSAGIYFVSLKADGQKTLSRKVIRLK